MVHRAARGASGDDGRHPRGGDRPRVLGGCAPRDDSCAKGAVMKRRERMCGFSTIELLIAAVVMVIVILTVFGVAHAAPDAYARDTEIADMHQRLRVAQVEL